VPFEWSFSEAERVQAEPPLIPGVTGLKPLGQGGMGDVFLGVDATGRRVAVKVSRRLGKEALDRFQREAELLGRFRSDAVVRAHSWGTVRDTAYLVCEYVDGETLDVVARRCPGPQARLELLVRVCRAVGVAHREGVVHRDLKPSNVLVQPSGEVKLIDFGVSIGLDQERMTQTGALLGTPHYMAPEQFRGEAPTPASDVWSLAVVGYELLAGRLPFVGSTLPELANGWSRRPPQLQGVGAGVNRVILGALNPKPGGRAPDAAAFADALEAALERDRRGAPSAVGVTLCVFFALASCCGAYVALTRSADPDPDRVRGEESHVAAVPGEEPAEEARDASSRRVGSPTRGEVPGGEEGGARWPRTWSGELTAEEARYTEGLNPDNAHDDLQRLAALAERGEPRAARFYGLGLLVGGVRGLEQDRRGGFGYVVHAVEYGYMHAAGDLAALFVGEANSPESWAVYGYGDHRAALGLEEDLELAAALAYIGTQHGRQARTSYIVLDYLHDELRVPIPVSVAAAYRTVQDRLGSSAGVQAALGGGEGR